MTGHERGMGIMRTLRLAIVVVLSCGLFAVGLGAPVKVILDTDMYDDFDDIGALALLHALADEGKCEILATVSSTRETPSVGVCQLVNASYGRPDIPVGAPALGKHGKPFLAYPFYEDLVRRHPEVFPTSDLAPDAVSVYRRALASSPDGSVTICSVGFLTNLRRLLESSAEFRGDRPSFEVIDKWDGDRPSLRDEMELCGQHAYP